MKIIGNTVGTSLPKPDLRQTDPRKGDFVKGKDEFLKNSGSGVVAQPTPPEDTSVIWIDTSDNEEPQIPEAVTDEHINALIDAKLGVIENGTY